MVKGKTGKWFWFEAGLSSLSALLFVITLLWRDWIELVFHVDPDGHNGSLEWLIAGALFTASLCFGALAVGEMRRPNRAW